MQKAKEIITIIKDITISITCIFLIEWIFSTYEYMGAML